MTLLIGNALAVSKIRDVTRGVTHKNVYLMEVIVNLQLNLNWYVAIAIEFYVCNYGCKLYKTCVCMYVTHIDQYFNFNLAEW